MYKVLVEKRAEKDLNALDRSVGARIVERLLLLKNNPRPTGSKKLAGSRTACRLRVGDFRIIYEVNDKNKEVKIYRIKHRSKAYQ
ncbi:MAG: type II toxin-antitoxin system RelE/ParE family toxin [Candidatus Liptonbacteria bacterium]|nr:type II toxin-antitoxin system RelE/ParE family toxin [Candidatus Liptonbacteria bacterium]